MSYRSDDTALRRVIATGWPVDPDALAGMADDAPARDALHGIALVHLRHRDVPRALVLLLLALHIAPPTQAILLATAEAFLDLGEPEQALACLDRSDRDFGALPEATVLRARGVARLEGLDAGREVFGNRHAGAPPDGAEQGQRA